MKKKKAPKIKKKIPGYQMGGTTLAYQTGNPNAEDTTIYKPEKKGKGTFKQQLGDFGRGSLETLAGLASVDIDPKYQTGGGQKYGQTHDKFIAPVTGVAGAMALNTLAPGAGTAMKAAGKTASGYMDAKRMKRLPDETDSEYSKRMAALGIDVSTLLEDEATALAVEGVAGNLATMSESIYEAGKDIATKAAGVPLAEGGEVKGKKISKDFVLTMLPEEKKDTTKKKATIPPMQRKGLQKIGIGIHPQNKADGGEIDGPGTEKSDSINAKVKPGSFVVPAENAHIAALLDEKVFGKEDKANLKQKGGTPVRLSDNEYLFTPEKKNYLETVLGMDLSKLAPNAKPGNAKANGGTIDKDIDALIQAIEKEEKDLKIKSQQFEKSSKDKEQQSINFEAKRRYQQELDNLAKMKQKVIKAAKPVNRSVDTENVKRLAKEYYEAASQVEQYADPKNYKSGALGATFSPELAKKNKPAKKESSTITPTAYDTFAQAVNASADNKDTSLIGSNEALQQGSNRKKTAPATMLDTDMEEIAPKQYTQIPGTDNGQRDLAKRIMDSELTKPITPVTTADATGRTSGKADVKKRNYDLGAGLDLGLGIGQTAIAIKSLLSDGSRPVDGLSREYLDTIESAKDQSAYGFSNAEKLLAKQDIESNRRAMTDAAVNLGGGNFATTMGNTRVAGNVASRNLVELAAADNTLKLQKQRYRDSLIADKVEKDRRLFEDKLNAFNVNQQAGSEMLQSGIQSIQNSAANRRSQKMVDSLLTQ